MNKLAPKAVRPLQLLVVDDGNDTAETTAVILRHTAHTVAPAAGGDSALEAVTGSWPGIFLLDLVRPGFGGIEVGKCIRALTGSRNEPLVTAVTRLATPSTERRQFPRFTCAKKAICCPNPHTRVYVLVENISRLGMVAKAWSQLELNTSVEIILSSGVIVPATVVRITGFATNRVVAFEFGRLLAETELSTFVTPVWQTEIRADLALTNRCSAVVTRVGKITSLYLCPQGHQSPS